MSPKQPPIKDGTVRKRSQGYGTYSMILSEMGYVTAIAPTQNINYIDRELGRVKHIVPRQLIDLTYWCS